MNISNIVVELETKGIRVKDTFQGVAPMFEIPTLEQVTIETDRGIVLVGNDGYLVLVRLVRGLYKHYNEVKTVAELVNQINKIELLNAADLLLKIRLELKELLPNAVLFGRGAELDILEAFERINYAAETIGK